MKFQHAHTGAVCTVTTGGSSTRVTVLLNVPICIAMNDSHPTVQTAAALHEALEKVLELALSGKPDHQTLLLLAAQLKTAIEAGGGWVLAAYFTVYTLLTALCLPGGSVLMLIGGACMGFAECLLLSNAACTLGAWMTFVGARMGLTGLRQFKQARRGTAFAGAQSSPDTPHDSNSKKNWLQVIDTRLADQQIPFLLSIRLAPVIPFAAFNILAAFTSLGHWRFLWTSFAGGVCQRRCPIFLRSQLHV